MAVDQYALTSLANVKEYMGLDDDDVQQNGLALYCSATDATVATVEVTDTTVVLVITSGTSAGTTTLTLADAANDTLGELTSVIDGTTGWTARLLGPSAQASGDLIPAPQRGCLLHANEQTLVYQGNELIEALIDRVSDKIETFCDRLFKSRDYREWRDGNRERTISVRNWPITAVRRLAFGSADSMTVKGSESTDLRATVEVQDNAVVLHRVESDGTETPVTVDFATYPTASDVATQIEAQTGWTATLGTNIISNDLHRRGGQDALGRTVTLTYPDSSDVEYRIREEAGLIEMSTAGGFDRGFQFGHGSRFPEGFQNILVEYTGGYATIPDDLEQIAIELVSQMYNARAQDPNLQSESIGSYSYSLAKQVDIEGDLAARLTMWKEPR